MFNLYSFSAMKMSCVNCMAECEAPKSQKLFPELHESSVLLLHRQAQKFYIFCYVFNYY